MKNPFARLFKSKEKSVTIVGTEFFTGFDNQKDVNNLSSYKDSLYLNIGVSMVARRVAGIPLELYKIKNKKGEVDEVLDHPILALLANPNPRQTRREFNELSVTYYLLSGDCFWYLERNGNKIIGMETLRPDLVEVLLSPDKKRILGYEYRSNTIQRFLPEDIIHIKSTDPTNPLRGVGVVRPATARILTEIEATRYQSKFFENQGRPDMAVFADAEVTDEIGADFRRKWKGIFGRGNGGQVALFGSNIKSAQELNKTPKEMDFIETQKFLRTDILSALHIPEEMVSSMADHATSPQVYRMYLQEAVVPVLEAFLDAINNRLAPMMDMAVFFDFEDPVPVDRDMRLKETTELKKNGIITANEARTLYNYDLVEGADTLSTHSSVRPEVVENAVRQLRNRPLLMKKLKAIEAITLTITSSEPKRGMTSIFPTRAAKEAYAKAYNEKADRKALKVQEAINDVHKAMEKRILETDLNVNGFMDVPFEKKQAKDALTPVMLKLYTEGGQEALDALMKKSADHFFADAVLLAAIEGRVEFFTNSIMDTTFDILKAKIIDGVKAGDGVDKIAASIRDYFEDMSKGRAKTIAQTETNFVLSKATNDAYAQSPVVTGVEWLSVGDDKVREDHVANEAQGVIPKGATFQNGEAYPAEHSVNCRCALLPAV